jgi:DNA polymerase elongation subunit (family B)
MFAEQGLNASRKNALIKGLSLLPPSFALTPTNGNKIPYRTGWQQEPPVPRNTITSDIRTGKAKGYGLRTGEVSNGILAVDVDGHLANALLRELSDGQELPKTVAFTSGLPGKCQYLLQVPQEYWNAIATRKFKTEPDETGKKQQLELRWNACQSILPPSVHPTTGQYKWVDGCSPAEREIAVAPSRLIELMLVEPVADAEIQAQPSTTTAEISRARSYLAALSPSRADDYDTWLKIGMALKSIDDSLLEDWDTWSQQSDKYKPGDCKSKWESFKRDQTNKRVTIGTLRQMAIDDDRKGKGNDSPPISNVSLADRVKDILQRSQSQADRKSAFISLASSTKTPLRELEQLAEAIENDEESSEELERVKVILPELLASRNETIDPAKYLWGDGGTMAEAMKTVARSMPTSDAMIFSTFIPVAASRIGTSSRIVIKASAKYRQPCIFWTAVVSRSGTLKTPAQAVAIDPLLELEVSAKKAYDADVARYEQEQEEWEKGDSKPQKPEPRKRYLTKDSTLETLESIHNNNPRGLLYYRDELAGLFKARNSYKPGGKGSDEEAELDQWNGSPVIVDRKAREIALGRTAISRTGSIQYEVLQKIAAGHEDVNGNLARWLFCAVKAPLRYIEFDNAPDTGISESFKNLYINLEKLPEQDYFIDAEAQEIFRTWQHSLVDAEREEHHPGLKLVYPKIEGYTARFALLLHCVNAVLAGETPTQVIPGGTMALAAELAAFYLSQAKLLYATNSPQYGLTGRLLKLYQFAEGKPGGITPRDAKQSLRDFRKLPAPEIKKDFSALVDAGRFQIKDNRFFVAEDVVSVVTPSTNLTTPETTNNQDSQQNVDNVDTSKNSLTPPVDSTNFGAALNSSASPPSIFTNNIDNIDNKFSKTLTNKSVGGVVSLSTNLTTNEPSDNKIESDDSWDDESNGFGGSNVVTPKQPSPDDGGGVEQEPDDAVTTSDNKSLNALVDKDVVSVDNVVDGVTTSDNKLSDSIAGDRELVHLVEESGKQRLAVDESGLNLYRGRGFELPAWTPTLKVKPYEQMRRVVVDIETLGLDSETDRIIAIGLKLGDKTVIITNSDEATMLGEFNNLLAKWQPDVICGHNIMGFDAPFITKRCSLHGIKSPFRISERESCLRATVVNGKPITYKDVYARDKRINLIDSYHLIALFDKPARELSCFRLKTSVLELGLREETRLELSAEQIKSAWHSGDFQIIEEYLRYDLEDTELLMDCLLPQYHYLALVVPGMTLQSLVLRGHGSKWQRVLERHYGRSPEADTVPHCDGAERFTEKAGLFRNVASVDVASLYPSIQLKYGVCSGKDTDRYSLQVLQYLTNERLRLKKLGKAGDVEAKRQSDALKILLNSLTGMLGTRGIPFNDPVAFSLVTSYGRRILKLMAKTIEECGGKVAFGDTDGIVYASDDIPVVYKKLVEILPEGIKLDAYENWDALYIPAGKDGEAAKCTYIYWKDGKAELKGGRYTNRDNPSYLREYEINFLSKYLSGKLTASQNFHNDFVAQLNSGEFPTTLLSCRRVVQPNSKFKHLAKVGEKATYWVGESGNYTNTEAYNRHHYVFEIELLYWQLMKTLGHDYPKPSRRKKKTEENLLFQ